VVIAISARNHHWPGHHEFQTSTRRTTIPPPDAVARYATIVAREGQGDQLAQALLAAAAELDSDPGCDLYLVNRQVGQPDIVWVTELWRSQQDLDASIERIRGSDGVAAVMELVTDWKMIELEPLGGKPSRFST
jgi:quinol monooxygenase YgiN